MQKIELSDIDKGFEYYCKGLNSKEIGLLLNCSYRTVQNYMCSENWKNGRKERRDKEKKRKAK